MSKRLISLILIFALVLSMSGCGRTTTETETQALESTTRAIESTTRAIESTTRAIESTTLTLWGGFNVIDGIQDDPVSKIIEEKLGIKLHITRVGDGEAQERYSVVIASNDLPDMFEVLEKTLRFNAINAGLILPLDDLLPEYGPNLISDVYSKVRIDFSKNFDSPDGKLYTIKTVGGGGADPFNPVAGNYIRWDIYKEAGMPDLKTTDDLLNALLKMQQTYPETEEGKKVYAMGFWFAEGPQWGDIMAAVIGFPWGYSHPGSSNFYTFGSFNIRTRNFEGPYPVTDKNSLWYEQLKNFFNKAYRMGLIDPDSWIQKYDQWYSKVKEGRYLFTNWTPSGYNKLAAEAGKEGVGYYHIPPLDGADKMVLSFQNISGERSILISKKCKNPEKAVQLLDYATSTEGNRLLMSGVEGVHYVEDVSTGKLKMTEEFLENMNDINYGQNSGIGKYRQLVGLTGIVKLNDGNCADLRSDPDYLKSTLLPWQIEAREFFGFPDEHGSYPSLKTIVYDKIYEQAIETVPDDLKKYEADVNNYMFNQFFRIIRAESEAEFDAMVEEIINRVKELRGEEVYNFKRNSIEEAREILEPLVKEAYGD